MMCSLCRPIVGRSIHARCQRTCDLASALKTDGIRNHPGCGSVRQSVTAGQNSRVRHRVAHLNHRSGLFTRLPATGLENNAHARDSIAKLVRDLPKTLRHGTVGGIEKREIAICSRDSLRATAAADPYEVGAGPVTLALAGSLWLIEPDIGTRNAFSFPMPTRAWRGGSDETIDREEVEDENKPSCGRE
jgi:hypothetical protein